MNLKPLLLAVGLTFVEPVKADAPTPAKIAYVSKVPSAIRKGAVGRKYTRFFGKTVIEGQTLALHFYDTQRLKTDENGHSFQKSRLDVYLETHRNARSTYKRINSVPITYDKPVKDFAKEEKFTVQSEKMWLYPGSQKGPILHFNLSLYRLYAPQEIGDMAYDFTLGMDALFLFPQGVAGQAMVQQFGDGGDIRSSQMNNFGTLDKEGCITVYRQLSYQGGRTFEGWRWNGTQFVEADRNYLGGGEAGKCEWDGEKITKTVYEP